MQRKMERNEFTLEDYRDSLGQMKKLGSLESIMSMLPGEMFKGMPKMTPEMSARVILRLRQKLPDPIRSWRRAQFFAHAG